MGLLINGFDSVSVLFGGFGSRRKGDAFVSCRSGLSQMLVRVFFVLLRCHMLLFRLLECLFTVPFLALVLLEN